MGLSILPKGGASFRSSSGFGSFQSRLKQLTRREGGEFGVLKNNQAAIAAAIGKKADVIRSKGGLNRAQQKSVFHEITGSDKNLSQADKYKVKELISYYARNQKAQAAKPAAASPRPRPGVLPERKAHIAVNRDPNFQSEYQGLSVQEHEGGRFAIRGEASRAALNYEKMSRLGGGEGARNLQKDAFNKLQQAGGGLIKRR